MIDFLLSEGLSILLTISVFLYTFLILWIKTKKNKYFIISASLLTIIVILGTTNYYIAFHSNYNSAKFEELYFKKIPKEEMVITLTEIKNSEENKNFGFFRDMIDYYINKEDLTEEEYFELVQANKNSDFKMAIQYSKQEIEDLKMLLKLTEEIK